MTFKNKKIFLVITFFLILLFLFFRFYKIDQSFFFFNDMGRDSYTLLKWKETGKPPLLGPQTSALPINQSAIYFYFLYPLFLLTNQNPYYALYTSAFIYIFIFLFCLFLSRKNSNLLNTIFVAFFLFAIHPQFIIQNRYIWNPSLAPPFLLLSLVSLLLAQINFNNKYLALMCLSISIAVSLTYSVAPFLIAFIILSYFYFKKHFFKILIYLFSSLVLINLPTIFFELRHGFLLTKSLLSKGAQTQTNFSLINQVQNLAKYTFSFQTSWLNLAILIVVLILSFYLLKSKTKNKIIPHLFLLTLFITLISPINIQAHYVFAILVLIFVTISLLPKLILIPLAIILSFSFLKPIHLNSYFSPAPRSYQQTKFCYQQICADFKNPVFSAVQSDLHPYHHGPEHRYLLKISGCDLKEIETELTQANHMFIIEDSGTFTPQQTKFYELSLFGDYQFINSFECLPNLKVSLIEKS